jgi:4-carboxymuconolactone decarboxylase
MSHMVRFQETLRRLTMIDEAFVEGQAGLGLGLAGVLDARTTALLRLGVAVAIGSPAVCLEWSTGRALAAGATEDEIAHVLVAIAPVAGLPTRSSTAGSSVRCCRSRSATGWATCRPRCSIRACAAVPSPTVRPPRDVMPGAGA